MLPHLPRPVNRIVITGQTDELVHALYSDTSGILIHLPAPIAVLETESFGMPTPTSSTTIALALTDALAIATARQLHADPAAVFRKYHPGGVIGANAKLAR